jgi:hypothetical protein
MVVVMSLLLLLRVLRPLLLLLLLLLRHSICYELPKVCWKPRVCVQEQALSSAEQDSTGQTVAV